MNDPRTDRTAIMFTQKTLFDYYVRIMNNPAASLA